MKLKRVVPTDYQLTKSHNDAMTDRISGVILDQESSDRNPWSIPAKQNIAFLGELSKNYKTQGLQSLPDNCLANEEHTEHTFCSYRIVF